jgi:hypothetical protein
MASSWSWGSTAEALSPALVVYILVCDTCVDFEERSFVMRYPTRIPGNIPSRPLEFIAHPVVLLVILLSICAVVWQLSTGGM